MEVGDALPHVFWTLNFMEEEGYEDEKNELNQDNISSMKVEKNEKDQVQK